MAGLVNTLLPLFLRKLGEDYTHLSTPAHILKALKHITMQVRTPVGKWKRCACSGGDVRGEGQVHSQMLGHWSCSSPLASPKHQSPGCLLLGPSLPASSGLRHSMPALLQGGRQRLNCIDITIM
eukprot:1137660-Pelagomonas_calceolata.AAC.1